jgi:hypothetical protein
MEKRTSIHDISNNVLFDRILSILQDKFGNIPKTGVIAGQAVASAVYEIMGLTDKGPYNDLDVFVTEKDMDGFLDNPVRAKAIGKLRQEGDGHRHPKSRKTAFKNSIAKHETYVGLMDDPLGRQGYTIKNCFHDPLNGLHNYIVIEEQHIPDWLKKNENTKSQNDLATLIVNSFDINCCQIAIDLSKKTVSFTNDFENFLFQRNIQVSNALTPMHTAVRLVKKSKEMPFFTCDIEGNMLLLQTARKIVSDIEVKLAENTTDKPFFSGQLFSDIYVEKFNNHKDILSAYFTLEKKDVSYEIKKAESDNGLSNDSSDVNPKGVFSEYKYIPNEEAYEVFYVLKPDNWHDDHKQKIQRFIKLCSFQYKSFNSIEDTLFYTGKVYNILNHDSWVKNEFLRLLDVCEKNKLDNDGCLFLFNNLIYNNFESFKGLSDECLIRTARLMTDHTLLMSINFLGYKSSDFNKLIVNLKWLENNDMRYRIGELEQAIQAELQNVFDKESHMKIKLLTDSFLIHNFRDKALSDHAEKLESMRDHYVSPLFSKMITDFNSEEYHIKELCSETDLFVEGNKVHHCVGGYWPGVSKGNCHIFSIMKKDQPHIRSTLQLSINDFKVFQNQHFTYKNTEPTAPVMNVANELKYFITKEFHKIKTKFENGQENIASEHDDGDRVIYDFVSEKTLRNGEINPEPKVSRILKSMPRNWIDFDEHVHNDDPEYEIPF